MIKKGWLPVDVKPGLFSSERSVTFDTGKAKYSLIVDQADLSGGNLAVYIVAEQGNEAVIALPRETFTSGSRVRVPREVVKTSRR